MSLQYVLITLGRNEEVFIVPRRRGTSPAISAMDDPETSASTHDRKHCARDHRNH